MVNILRRFFVAGAAGLIVASSVIALLPVSPANAAPTASTSTALSVVPRRDMDIKPGQTVKDKLYVTNLSKSSSLNLSIQVIDFTYYDQSGSPKFTLDKSAPPTPWSLRPYMSVPSSLSIAPGKSKSVAYQVKMPGNIGGGSYYSAIIYSTGSPSSGNVNLSASGVTLVFANVPGKVNEKLNLKRFGSYSVDKSGNGSFTYFNLNKPKLMAYLLKNEGNVTEAPAGSITLRDMWGDKVLTVDSANLRRNLALIGQTRLFTTCIKPKSANVDLQNTKNPNDRCDDSGLSPGRYTATLNLYYGHNGNPTQEIHKTIVFWYIPIWLIIAIIVGLLIIAYIVWRIVRWIKQPRKHKKHISKRQH